MPQFRKKPVVIEALQFDGSWTSAKPILDWMGESWPLDVSHPRWSDRDGGLLFVTTLEGVMTAQPHDWIIKGVQGEFYPCKPDIFAATYEAV
ncbi:hypothetical protein L2449_27340 [Mesorhizobium muleiense]|uniref:hypothetical protein n=1 Tax=Mesorhizobium muleiense TaxID=1004279 RepID=UPI001F2871F3|nr:hypothetical protein [Mesorhizobium muleiense]MCF6120543.1 hypothetical protein [Mesorhizobium muleiense]